VTVDLRAAAFGDRPGVTVNVAADAPARDRWLAAVVLGGQGHYARAAALLRPLLRGPDPTLGALAGAALASHLRQLGGHAMARRLDAEAARRLTEPSGGGPKDPDRPGDPDDVDRTGALVDVLLGLAADAIGTHRPGQARRLHAAAVRAAAGGDRPPGWRVTVRVQWVATELALATGDPTAACGHAERARAVATAVGAARHTVKSTMMLGAALATGGTPDGRSRAESLLTEALTESLTWGMLPLAWPCALLLTDVRPDQARERSMIVSELLTSVFSRSDTEMTRIGRASVWMPTALIRSGEPPRSGDG
jgi:hypothetical protein